VLTLAEMQKTSPGSMQPAGSSLARLDAWEWLGLFSGQKCCPGTFTQKVIMQKAQSYPPTTRLTNKVVSLRKTLGYARLF
jgi:hypothetical protein